MVAVAALAAAVALAVASAVAAALAAVAVLEVVSEAAVAGLLEVPVVMVVVLDSLPMVPPTRLTLSPTTLRQEESLAT